MDSTTFSDNKDKRQFELNVDNCTCLLCYAKPGDGNIELYHTEVPVQLEGKGHGSQLVEKCLEKIDEEGLKVIPSCSFVRRYIERHPEWQKLL